eukprot:m.117724 g.117724  ORF g.117724 m.117724 type:complete len:88 (-) comp15551_c0_seq6:1873-2136(-)
MLTDFCHAAILMDVTAEAFMQAASMQAHDPETQAVLNEEPTQRKPHKRKVQHAKLCSVQGDTCSQNSATRQSHWRISKIGAELARCL